MPPKVHTSPGDVRNHLTGATAQTAGIAGSLHWQYPSQSYTCYSALSVSINKAIVGFLRGAKNSYQFQDQSLFFLRGGAVGAQPQRP